VIVQIFFSELKLTHVETQAAYSALALLSDIGGTLGLVLGSSVLTICEIADFLFILAATWIKHRASQGRTQAIRSAGVPTLDEEARGWVAEATGGSRPPENFLYF